MGNTVLNGHAQTAHGALNTVTVTDTRGTNAGWTLTGQLEGDFINATPGNENGNTTVTGVEPNSHNRIPASNLSWAPSVSLTARRTAWLGDVAAGTGRRAVEVDGEDARRSRPSAAVAARGRRTLRSA